MKNKTATEEQMVVVPIEQLQPGTLARLIEEFVTREGTDYGHEMPALEKKVEQVRKQLERGKACIVFDGSSETFSIVAADRISQNH